MYELHHDNHDQRPASILDDRAQDPDAITTDDTSLIRQAPTGFVDDQEEQVL